jgi:hypothetical protein
VCVCVKGTAIRKVARQDTMLASCIPLHLSNRVCTKFFQSPPPPTHTHKQVGAAWAHLREAAEASPFPISFPVTARRSDSSHVGRGIYMREPWETVAGPATYLCVS